MNERDEKLLDDLGKAYPACPSCADDYDAAEAGKMLAAYREEILEEDEKRSHVNQVELRDARRERDYLKARDAETVAALERAGFAHPGASPADNIAEMDAEVERLRRNEQLIYFADGSSRMVEGPEAAIEYRVLCAKETERLKTEVARLTNKVARLKLNLKRAQIGEMNAVLSGQCK